MCRAGCFGPLTWLAHRAVAEADDTEPAVVATAMYDAWVNSGGTARALIENGDMHLCDQFERDAMWYMNLCMHHTDCARAILADLELVQTHTNYPKVMRALLEISTRDDIFVKSECTVMTFVVWIWRWPQKLGDTQGAEVFHEAIVKRFIAKNLVSAGKALRSRHAPGPPARRGLSSHVRLVDVGTNTIRYTIAFRLTFNIFLNHK